MVYLVLVMVKYSYYNHELEEILENSRIFWSFCVNIINLYKEDVFFAPY
jgi:hypothetical protein